VDRERDIVAVEDGKQQVISTLPPLGK